MKKAPIIATPHLGEMSRLSGVDADTLKQDLPSHALALQKRLQVTLVAKDARTVVAGSGQMIYINTSGNSGMAKAGSGDVLAGIIGAMLAMKLEPMQAACLGVYLHGLAGDRARDIERLVSAMAEIRRRYSGPKTDLMVQEYIEPIVAVSPQAAFYAEKESLPLRRTCGRICSEFVMCYPPGIPILSPGEEITEEILDYIEYAKEKGCSMTGPEDPGIERLNVIRGMNGV